MVGERILVVDDEPSVVEVVGLYLEREGYRVSVARDGNAALEAVRREQPDLIVLDLMLPEMDGLEVTRRLRGYGDIPIPIIMYRRRWANWFKLASRFPLKSAKFQGKPVAEANRVVTGMPFGGLFP